MAHCHQLNRPLRVISTDKIRKLLETLTYSCELALEASWMCLGVYELFIRLVSLYLASFSNYSNRI